MKGLFLAERLPNKQWQLLVAKKASQKLDKKQRFVIANEGYQYLGTPGQRDYRVIHFNEYGIRIHAGSEGLSRNG